MRKGFSLVECLVVVAIIGVLAAFLFPVLASAKDRARAASDISALAQLGHAYALYESEYGAYPRRLSAAVEIAGLPNALVFSRLDPYSDGEASELTGDHTRAVSFIDPCDYPILMHGGRSLGRPASRPLRSCSDFLPEAPSYSWGATMTRRSGRLALAAAQLATFVLPSLAA